MSGFVSPPPSAAQDPQAPAADLVAGDDFYPGVSVAEFQDAMRIPSAVSAVRAREALRGAMLTVRRELRGWKSAQVAGGTASLADVADEMVDGKPAAVLLYRRAVFAHAAADLADTHNDISATGDGKDRLEGRAVSADELRRNGTHAVRDLLGVLRTTVELI